MILCLQFYAMKIDTVPIGDIPEYIGHTISDGLRSEYGINVSTVQRRSIPDSAFNRDRNQYDAQSLVDRAARTGHGKKSIGVTTVDLYYRDRNYVFGLGYLNGNGAVVSTHRLENATSGGVTKPSDGVVAERLRKEANHFVGNMLDLEHCPDGRCVMSFTRTVTGIDKLDESLCDQCRGELVSKHGSRGRNQDLTDIFGSGDKHKTRVTLWTERRRTRTIRRSSAGDYLIRCGVL